jgi:hypothetical protein
MPHCPKAKLLYCFDNERPLLPDALDALNDLLYVATIKTPSACGSGSLDYAMIDMLAYVRMTLE